MSREETYAAELARADLRPDGAGPLLRVWEGNPGIDQFRRLLPALGGEVLRQAAFLGQHPTRIMLSSIEPGQEVAPHTDAYDGYRWHFPLTAPVYWWDAESGDAVLGLWHWSPVNARIMHTVRNPTETRRVTLIVDFVT